MPLYFSQELLVDGKTVVDFGSEGKLMGGRRSVRSALRWGTSDDVDALEMKNTEDSYSGTL